MMKNNSFVQRRTSLQKKLTFNQALLISSASDIFYFSGFQFLVPEEREALLVVTKKSTYLIHSTFSPLLSDPTLTFLSSCHHSQLQKHFETIKKTHPALDTLIIDPDSFFFSEYQSLAKLGLTILQNCQQLTWPIRIKKDLSELKKIKASCHLAKKSLAQIWPQIKAGISEIELQKLLEAQMISLGSTTPAFPTIIAFGKNTALPHHQPTKKILKKEMSVLIDFGATVDGYRSDMTRTFWFGDQPNAKFTKIKQSVDSAYQQALKVIKTNLNEGQILLAKTVDQSARETIQNDGFGPYFIHTTGHGVGLNIHEPPSLNWQNTQPIRSGMVITIEPGIYLSNQFGYRHENTVYLSDDKIIELTK